MNKKKADNIPTKKVIKIVPKPGEWHQRDYANFALVSKTPFDISIKFCDIPPIEEEFEKEIIKKGKLEAPIATEVVLPPEIAEGLIQALQTQLEEFKRIKKEQRKLK